MKKAKIGMIILTCAFLCVLLGLFIGRQHTGDRITLVHSDSSIDLTVSNDDGFININTASSEELQVLPGVGKVLAQRIITYRQENGPFKAPEDLCNVDGIGSMTFNALEKYITVGGNHENSGS